MLDSVESILRGFRKIGPIPSPAPRNYPESLIFFSFSVQTFISNLCLPTGGVEIVTPRVTCSYRVNQPFYLKMLDLLSLLLHTVQGRPYFWS